MLLNTIPAQPLIVPNLNLQPIVNIQIPLDVPRPQDYLSHPVISQIQSFSQVPIFLQVAEPAVYNNPTPVPSIVHFGELRGMPQASIGALNGALDGLTVVDNSQNPNSNIYAYVEPAFAVPKSQSTQRKTQTPVKSYLCTVCGKVFQQRSAMKKHLNLHLPKSNPCTICSKSFKQAYHLKRHMLTHTGEKHHVCSFCSKAFGRSDHLQKHITTHGSEKPYVCSFCGYTCLRVDILKTHIAARHQKPKDILVYECTHCQRGFTCERDLISHMELHIVKNYAKAFVKDFNADDSGRKDFVWDNDAKRFYIRNIGTRNHRLEDNPDDCYIVDSPDTKLPSPTQQCSTGQEDSYVMATNQSNSSKWDITEDLSHMWDNAEQETILQKRPEHGCNLKAPTESMSYICCGEAFYNLSDLDMHKRMHHLENRHRCGECGEMFSERLQLEVHRDSHTDQDVTGSVSSNPHLAVVDVEMMERNSMLSVSGLKRHKGSDCGRKFRKLKRHRRKAHKEGSDLMGTLDTTGAKLTTSSEFNQKYSQCGMCVNGFVQEEDLKVHINLHRLLNW